MPPVQLQVEALQVVPEAHPPPQSVLQAQLQLAASAWYVGPQLSAAVSQTQPQTPPVFWNW